MNEWKSKQIGFNDKRPMNGNDFMLGSKYLFKWLLPQWFYDWYAFK